MHYILDVFKFLARLDNRKQLIPLSIQKIPPLGYNAENGVRYIDSTIPLLSISEVLRL